LQVLLRQPGRSSSASSALDHSFFFRYSLFPLSQVSNLLDTFFAAAFLLPFFAIVSGFLPELKVSWFSFFVVHSLFQLLSPERASVLPFNHFTYFTAPNLHSSSALPNPLSLSFFPPGRTCAPTPSTPSPPQSVLSPRVLVLH